VLTIDQSVQLIFLLLILCLILAFWTGVRQIRSARNLPYFLLRRDRLTLGWRWILIGIFIGVIVILVRIFGLEVAYNLVPPTPSITPTASITLTPTITATPSITLTPTITGTPTITFTPTETRTPILPEALAQLLILDTVTPNPDAAFSPIAIASRLDQLNRPLDTSDTFENPVGKLFGAFTYNNLQNGVRWTAIWYFGQQELCIETQPWDGGTGGYGYTECEPALWRPGEYEVQMFLGKRWVISTRFTIVGEPPIPTRTPSPSATQSSAATP
jgi:hypothetical protein